MSHHKERVYASLPLVLQNLAVTIEGHRINRSRYRPPFDSHFAAYLSRSFASTEAIRSHRDSRLRAFLKHAVENCRFYQQSEYRGLQDVERLEDLSSFPILSKEQVRAELGEIKPPPETSGPTMMSHTSGTTGAGLVFPVTKEFTREQWAVWWRYRSWHGIARDQWCAHFGGRNIAQDSRNPYRFDRGQRRLLFSSYHTTPEALDGFLISINRQRISWLHGYPSFIALVARRAIQTDWRADYPIRWVTTGAENLTSLQQTVISRAFGREAIQHYGLAEGTANISECTEHSLHIDEDFSAVEIVRDEIVGTNFANLAFPLVRYRTGDNVTDESPSCPCGRPGRTISRLDGRLEDYLVLNDRSHIGRLDHLFKDSTHITAAQFQQDQPGKADLLVIPTSDFGHSDELSLIREIDDRLGGRIDIKLHYVEQIPSTPSGKVRLVVRSPSTNIG